MVNVLSYNRCIWEVFDPEAAGKQLHKLLTKHIPMAKGSPVTPITSCYLSTGGWDCTVAVQLIAAGRHGPQENGRQYHWGCGGFRPLLFSPLFSCWAIFGVMIKQELGFCHGEETCASLLPEGHWEAESVPRQPHASKGLRCEYHPPCNPLLMSSRLLRCKPHALRPTMRL